MRRLPRRWPASCRSGCCWARPPWAADRAEEDLLGRAPLVDRDDVLEGEELAHRVDEDVVGGRPGIRLVPVLDRRPLVAAHRPGARVGQQVDEHVLGTELEEVVRPPRRCPRRWSRVVITSGSTEWMRKGSMMVLKGASGIPPPLPYAVAPGIALAHRFAVANSSVLLSQGSPCEQRAGREEPAEAAAHRRTRGLLERSGEGEVPEGEVGPGDGDGDRGDDQAVLGEVPEGDRVPVACGYADDHHVRAGSDGGGVSAEV